MVNGPSVFRCEKQETKRLSEIKTKTMKLEGNVDILCSCDEAGSGEWRITLTLKLRLETVAR